MKFNLKVDFSFAHCQSVRFQSNPCIKEIFQHFSTFSKNNMCKNEFWEGSQICFFLFSHDLRVSMNIFKDRRTLLKKHYFLYLSLRILFGERRVFSIFLFFWNSIFIKDFQRKFKGKRKIYIWKTPTIQLRLDFLWISHQLKKY